MDIEWGRDGLDGKLYILQARPETVKSQEDSSRNLRRFSINGEKVVLCEGRAIGQKKVGQGKVRLVKDASEMDSVEAGDVLVTDMTDPDWEPVMKRASAIVTNRGGRTCHAAIIARELGIRPWSAAATQPICFQTAKKLPYLVPKAIPASSIPACWTYKLPMLLWTTCLKPSSK